MDIETTAALVAVAVVAGTLLLTGPGAGEFGAGQRSGTGLDDGTADVDDVELSGSPAITSGRFGTDVAYLRIPSVSVTLASVTDNPRIVYRLSVSGLGFDRAGTRLLGPGSRGVTVGMADQPVERGEIRREQYRATLSVHVQSFEVYRTVFRRNVTVGVNLDE